jgi:hypothetical protein
MAMTPTMKALRWMVALGLLSAACADGRESDATGPQLEPLIITAVFDRLSPSVYCSPPACEFLVFYADRKFGVRYGEEWEYPGTYSRNGSLIDLAFKEESWRATATIRGDSLIVTYNANASLSDFEDGTFRLAQGDLPPP